MYFYIFHKEFGQLCSPGGVVPGAELFDEAGGALSSAQTQTSGCGTQLPDVTGECRA